MRALLLPLLVTAAGCGPDLETRDACLEAYVGAMRELTQVFEGLTDKKAVEAARPKLKALAERVEEIREASKELGAPSAEEQERLRVKLDAATNDLMPRVEAAARRLESDRAASDAFAALWREFAGRFAPP
jgi:hypothetical protein